MPEETRRRVCEVYDRIAGHFSATRAHPWPDVEEFLADRSGEVGLDVGCGNARHTELLAARVRCAIGLDASRGLLGEAAERARDRGFAVSLLRGDAVALPVRSETVDIALYVATIHHLSERATRIESLNELARVLAPDGVGLVSAWSTTHERFDGREGGFDTTIAWTLPDGTEVERFYHIYDFAEFRADLSASELTARPFLSEGNCYAVVTA